MLAGLLFATHEADDRAGVLAATLPFGAATLIEYQARLLAECGATQIVVVVARLTPELTGALARIGQRGFAVDTVRSAADAAARLHPLARVLVMADALVTTTDALDGLGRDDGDALVVVPANDATRAADRIGGGDAWAGLARVDAGRLAEAAAMPPDWDLQATLLHVAVQAGAARIGLAAHVEAGGHGVERRAEALERRGRTILAASLTTRRGWFDRYVVEPASRRIVPAVARRGWSTRALAAAGALASLAGIVGAAWHGHAWPLVALAGAILLDSAAALASFRDEDALRRWAGAGVAAVPALAALGLGGYVDDASGGTSGRLLALGAVVAAAIGLRAMATMPRTAWWGSPGAFLLVAGVPAAVGAPVAGLAAAAAYAAATLAMVVEEQRTRLESV